MYDLLVLVHILSAMVWVGGGFILMANERHTHKRGGPAALYRLMRQSEWVDDWIFTPAPLLTVASGVTMVIMSDAWAFTQPWVYLALALIVTEFSVGYRDYKKMKIALEHGDASAEFRTALPAYMRMSVLAIGLLATVVVLMVLKPGV